MPPSFAELGVSPELVAAMARRSIYAPFPVQVATLPSALAGRDVSGKAPTGSGKTLAFGIAAVARLQGAPVLARRPRALILTPTRELCAQVASELASLGGNGPGAVRVASFYGGVGYQPQIRALARGVHIAVACPGRLQDLIDGGHARLDQVELVVLDEADRMADMGFLPAVGRLLDLTPSSRQTLLFSATLDGDVDVLVRRYQRDSVRHELADPTTDESRADHRFWKVNSADRADMTARVAATSGPTIVFCRTRHSTDRTARQLMARGVSAAAIHGDRSQAQRERALKSFVDGRVEALVATDVAARGIHVDGVAAVVHFDLPADAKDYVHRSGRTARAGAEGLVVSLVTPDKHVAAKKLQRDLGYPPGIVAPDVAVSGHVLRGPVEEPGHDRPVLAPSKRHKSADASGRPSRPSAGKRPVRTSGGPTRGRRPVRQGPAPASAPRRGASRRQG